MRITNNIILHNTSSNINGNKVNVDSLNQQMTSQKKIQRPSEDPVIAIRALRLRSNLSEIEQYYERNIPDAESWLDVTETALSNMKTILTDIRTQCEYGASDQITADDRKTILTTLEKLRKQVYSEGNADYAGRTVFTGYRTNKKLTFMEDETKTSYEISQKFTYSDLEEHRYYGNEVTVPQTENEVLNGTIADHTHAAYQRIRFAYGDIGKIDGETAGTVTDANNNTINVGKVELHYKDAAGTIPSPTIQATVYDTYEDWLAASGGSEYSIPDGEAVIIRHSGEMIFNNDTAATVKNGEAQLEIKYTKTGFSNGEVARNTTMTARM